MISKVAVVETNDEVERDDGRTVDDANSDFTDKSEERR